MTVKTIRLTGLACAGLLFSSCASDPYYSNGYGNGYPRQGLNGNEALAVAGAVVAGAALIGYANERSKRKDLERERNRYYYPSRHYGHRDHGWDGRGRDYRRRGW